MLAAGVVLLGVLAATPSLAQVDVAVAPGSPPVVGEAEALLARLEARYAGASTYRDAGHALTWHERDGERELTDAEALEMAFERASAPDAARAPAAHRWRFERATFGRWGRRHPTIKWSDGGETRWWTRVWKEPRGRRVPPGILFLDGPALPLRLALGAVRGSQHPFASFDQARVLRREELDGERCHVVELSDDRSPALDEPSGMHTRTCWPWPRCSPSGARAC